MSKSKGAAHRVVFEPPKREEQAAWLAGLFKDANSVASQTAAAYAELVDEVLLDVSRHALVHAELPPVRPPARGGARRSRCASLRPSTAADRAGLSPGRCAPTVPAITCTQPPQVAVEAHREAKLGLAPPPLPAPSPHPPPLAPQPGARGPTDAFGQSHPPSALEQITCMRCGRKVAAGRFAPHLEKCLGGGRQSSRHATRRGAG